MVTRKELEEQVREHALREGPVTYALVRVLQRMDAYPGDPDLLELVRQAQGAMARYLDLSNSSSEKVQAAVGKRR